jgi:hypothetical protein
MWTYGHNEVYKSASLHLVFSKSVDRRLENKLRFMSRFYGLKKQTGAQSV